MNSPLNPRIATAVLAVMLLAGVAHAVDADHDGMDDAWQTAYGIAAFTGGADPDGDGRPNLMESLNWTHPNDPANPDAGWGAVFIIDADHNGLDDIWEARHSPEGVILQAGDDSDGDGRTNLEESTVGTHPWLADWPWMALNNQQHTLSSTPGLLSLHLPATVPAKRYRLQRSNDLVNWSFDPSPAGTFWGDREGIDVDLVLQGEDHLFCRWVLDDPDDDADTLTGYTEMLLGTSDQSADSDGDGVPDAWEVKVGTNALVNDAGLDPDGDGKTNAQEYAARTHPRDFYNGAGSVYVSRNDSYRTASRSKVGYFPLNDPGGSTRRYFKRKLTEEWRSLNYTNIDNTDWTGDTPSYASKNELNYQVRHFTRTLLIYNASTGALTTTIDGAYVRKASQYYLRDWYAVFDGSPTHDEHTAYDDLVQRTLNGVTSTLSSRFENGGIQHYGYFRPDNPINYAVVLQPQATADPVTQSLIWGIKSSHPPATDTTSAETVNNKLYTKTNHWDYQYRGALFDEQSLLASPEALAPAPTDAEGPAQVTKTELSDEFTDAELVTVTNDLLAAAPWTATAFAYPAQWTFNSTGTRLDRRSLKYHFSFKLIPQITLEWTETYVPVTGDPVSTYRTWSGSNVSQSPEFFADTPGPGTLTVSNATVIRPAITASVVASSGGPDAPAQTSEGYLLARDAEGKCQTHIILRKIQPAYAMGTQRLSSWSTGMRLWLDQAGTLPASTAISYPADVETVLYADPDPGASLSTTLSTKTVSMEWTGAAGTTRQDSVTLKPLQVVSRDKFLAGSITLQTGWDQMQLEFLNTTTSENLGRYGNLLGGGSTKIYDDVHDILSEADIAAGSQPITQKVWFVRNASDARKIDFYTCFNAVGAVSIKIYPNATSLYPTGTVTHTLTAASDFGDWITYVDNWCKGVGFEFLDDTPPAAIAAAAAATELNHFTRACLIPLFTVVTMVEGMESVAKGLFDGVKAGLIDDKEFAKLIGSGAANAGSWSLETAQSEFNEWRSNPVKRAMELKQMTDQFCQDFIYTPLAQTGHALNNWNSIKQSAFAVYENMKFVGTRLYALNITVARQMCNGLMSWADNFVTRMAVEAERTAYNRTAWRNDSLLDDYIATPTRQMCYTFGYTVGYVSEQVLLFKSGATLSRFLARNGLTFSAVMLGRTSFAVTTRMHRLKRMVQGAAAAFELDAAVEKGLVQAAKAPVTGALIRNVTGEALESCFRQNGFNREVFNYKVIMDAIHDSTHIKALIKTAGQEHLFFERFAKLADTIGPQLTAEAQAGFAKAYERMLVFDASGVFVKDNFDELLRVMLPDNGAPFILRMDTALAQYSTGTGVLDLDLTTFMYAMIQDSGKVAATTEHAAVKAFRDLVEARAMEGTTLRRSEGVAITRYEMKSGRLNIRRPTLSDIPQQDRLPMVDYVDPSAPNMFIDVKGPIMKNDGLLEAYPILPTSRIDGLGQSAVDKVVNNNITLTPPLPTTVIVDTFGLTAQETFQVKAIIRNSGQDQSLFIFTDEL